MLAFLKGEAAAEEVGALLDGVDAALTSLGVADVLDHLVRIVGTDEEEATLDLAALEALDGLPVDASVGAGAGRLRARRYHRTIRPVSLADCVAAEIALATGRPIATSDPPLLDLCHDQAIPYLILAGSDGSRWRPPP